MYISTIAFVQSLRSIKKFKFALILIKLANNMIEFKSNISKN